MLYIIGVPFIDQLLAKITRLLLWIIKRKKYKLPPLKYWMSTNYPPKPKNQSIFILNYRYWMNPPSSFANGFGLRGNPVSNFFLFKSAGPTYQSLTLSFTPHLSTSLQNPHSSRFLTLRTAAGRSDEGGGGARDDVGRSGRQQRAPATTGARDGGERSLGLRGRRSSGQQRTEFGAAGGGGGRARSGGWRGLALVAGALSSSHR